MAKSEITATNGSSSKKYNCIFFDLDHTLWDYETNSRETLEELYIHYNLQGKGIDTSEAFLTQFTVVNTSLWNLLDRGLISSDVIRKERFKQILEKFLIRDQQLCEDLSYDYITLSPKKGKLMPYALEVLEYLAPHYQLSVITNGFDEIQHLKLQSGNLLSYFDHIITSERAGSRKPSCEIFNFALNCHGIKHHQAVMIGDNLTTDIGGACSAYIDAVFYNPQRLKHDGHTAYEITCLSELKRFL